MIYYIALKGYEKSLNIVSDMIEKLEIIEEDKKVDLREYFQEHLKNMNNTQYIIIDSNVYKNASYEIPDIMKRLKYMSGAKLIICKYGLTESSIGLEDYTIINMSDKDIKDILYKKLGIEKSKKVKVKTPKEKTVKEKKNKTVNSKGSKKVKTKINAKKIKHKSVTLRAISKKMVIALSVSIGMICLIVTTIYVLHKSDNDVAAQVEIVSEDKAIIDYDGEKVAELINEENLTETTTSIEETVTTQVTDRDSATATTQAAQKKTNNISSTTEGSNNKPNSVATTQIVATTEAPVPQVTTTEARIEAPTTISLSGYSGQIYSGGNVRAIINKVSGYGVGYSILLRDNTSTSDTSMIDGNCSYLCQVNGNSICFVEQ